MTDAGGDHGVERYEQLRTQALGGGPLGFRHGLALLERRGVAAWARAWQPAVPAARSGPSAGPVIDMPAGASELVGALASLALARIEAG